jgi:hypothetical protein
LELGCSLGLIRGKVGIDELEDEFRGIDVLRHWITLLSKVAADFVNRATVHGSAIGKQE